MIDIAIHIMESQVDCLAEAIYHEARGEDFSGQLYVGFVIKNRVMSSKFPDDFCRVIEQPWQFSFVHELDSTEMKNEEAKDYSYDVAEIILKSTNPFPDSMLYYHSVDVKPDWDYTKIDQYKEVGNHIFYVEVDDG